MRERGGDKREGRGYEKGRKGIREREGREEKRGK